MFKPFYVFPESLIFDNWTGHGKSRHFNGIYYSEIITEIFTEQMKPHEHKIFTNIFGKSRMAQVFPKDIPSTEDRSIYLYVNAFFSHNFKQDFEPN